MKLDALQPVLEEWVDEWIIKENFCPFAKPVRQQNRVKFAVCESSSWDQVYQDLRHCCVELSENSKIATTLIATPFAANDFFDYLSLLDGAEQLLINENWQGVFQIASFHPDYVFDSEPLDSPTHFTNRSPVPLLHILRESDVSKVIPSQDAADDIVERNQQRLYHIGLAHAKEKLLSWRRRLGIED